MSDEAMKGKARRHEGTKARSASLPTAYCLLPTLLLLVSSVFAQSTTPQRLLSEEQRQMQAGQRLEVVTERAASMAEDLRSNNLFKEIHGDRLVQIGKVTEDVHKTNVPPATDHLRKAREQVAAFAPHMDGADQEIVTIIAKLEKLWAGHGGQSIVDTLLAELRLIIQKQEQVKTGTGDWGRQLLQNVGDLEAIQRVLQRDQGELGDKTEAWHAKLTKAAENETDPELHEKLVRADKVMKDKKGTDLVKSAAPEIENKKPIAAAGQQDKALEVLREVEKILMEGEPPPQANVQEIVQQLQKLLEQQKALEQQMKAEQLDVQQAQLDQAALQAALEQLMQGMDLQQLQAALEAMQQAQQQMQQNQPPENSPAQALQAALQAALEQQKPEQGDPQPPEQGPPQPALAQQMPPKPTPPMPSLDPVEGLRLLAQSDKVQGTTADRTVAKSSRLEVKQREAVFEKYAGELPVEYRGLLQDYYQVLGE